MPLPPPHYDCSYNSMG